MAAAATLAAALAIGVVGIPGGGPTVNPAAAATLNAAADAVAEQPVGPVLREGQFWYVRSVSEQPPFDYGVEGSPDSFQPGYSGTSETWVGPDGTWRVLADYDDDAMDMDETFTGEPLRLGTTLGGTAEELAALPRDVDALYDLTEDITENMDGNDRPVNVQMFVLVTDLLAAGPLLPQDLRESLFRVAARIPGVQVTESIEDPLGRTGTALWMVENDTDERVEFIIDPSTGSFMASRALRPDGSIAYQGATVDVGIVDGIDARP
jgi:hypothetical protein